MRLALITLALVCNYRVGCEFGGPRGETTCVDLRSDAGATSDADAGADAGNADAGTSTVDAGADGGSADAGTSSVDAGVDAGSTDAGNTDAGTSMDGGVDAGATNDAGIALSGLALDLDPGNPASYPGSGTAVLDLSPYGNDGTLVGSPAFVSNGAGSYFTFNGADSMFITLGTASPAGWVFGRAPRTLAAWAYLASNRGGYSVLFCYGTGNDGQGSYLGTSNNGTQWNFGGYYTNQYGGTTYTNSWLYLAGVWDGTTASLYVNGVLLSASAQPNWDTVPGSIAKIGVDTPYPGEGWNGRVGRVTYYNRALTATEVMQNFNVDRGRYGL